MSTFFKPRRSWIPLILLLYFLLFASTTQAKEPINDLTNDPRLLERALSSSPFIHNNQAVLTTEVSSSVLPTTNDGQATKLYNPTSDQSVSTEQTPNAATVEPTTTEAAVSAAAAQQTNHRADVVTASAFDGHSTSTVTAHSTTTDITSSKPSITTDSPAEILTSKTPITSSSPASIQTHHTSTSLEFTTIKSSTSAPQSLSISSTVAPNTNSQSILISSTTTATDPSFYSTLYSTRSFSITSSTAVPSLVLGKNECSSDVHATADGICGNDYFCNAALKTCVALKNNGGQCYEDFQCLSSYCGQGNVCTVAPPPSSSTPLLSGAQIAGITVGCVTGAVVLLLGLIRWQRHSRQVRVRAARFRDFEGDGLQQQQQEQSTARWSKYNFLTQALHSDPQHSMDTANDAADDSQFYGTLASTSSDCPPTPHVYDPGLEMSSPPLRAPPQQNIIHQRALDSMPPGALARGVRHDHKPSQTTLDQKDYGYF